MNPIKLFLTLLLLSSQSLWAQTSNSVYTMFGIGQTTENSVGIHKGLGGTGIAFQSGSTLNFMNPASYLGVYPNSMVIESGAFAIFNHSKSKYTSQSANKVNISYFSTGIYFADWWAFSFGLLPFSYIDYQVNSTDEIKGELTTFDKNFTGSGGLHRVNLGNSFKIYKGLTAGFNTSYIFGLITQTEKALTSDDFSGYELTNKRRAHSLYFDYGIQYALERNQLQYTLGLIYGTGRRLSTTDELEFTYDGNVSELTQEDQADIFIPEKFGVGLAVKKGRNFKIGFDYERSNWSNLTFSSQYLSTHTSHRFSTGAEFSPAQKYTDSWYKKFAYRFGANYKQTYLEIDTVPINSMSVSLGLGIPLNAISLINLALEYGEEGTLENGLVQNRYWGLYLNFSLCELWGRRK